MKNNEYSYLDEKVLADMGFQVPTHRIIKAPYSGGGGRGRGWGLGLGLGFSLSLNLLLLLSLKYINISDATDSEEERKEETVHVKIVDQKSLEQLATGGFPQIVYQNPQAELGPETQYTEPNKNDNTSRLLKGILHPNYQLREKLRDTILAGKPPDELYSNPQSQSNADTMDYKEFFLVYLSEYLELKQNPALVALEFVQNNKIDFAMSLMFRINDDGKVNLVSYGQRPNPTKFERDIFNDVLTQFKRLPNFTPPSKANLKAPYEVEVKYYISYKTWRQIDLPAGDVKIMPF